MNGPRPSHSAEAARAAALQAEFNEKKWVWVPDEKEGYLAGWVHHEDEETAEIVLSAGGEIRRVPLYALSKMNPPKFDRVDDIADLTFLNEASVVHNLRLRYGSGAIYTYSGLFLVAINPYQNLPLYTDAIIQQYRNKRRDENPPHIFAVTERAWVNMQEERENQSILITGESGAGKTESTKKVIQYLSAIATDAHLPASSHTHSPSLSSSYSTIPSTGLPRSSSFRHKSVSITGSGGSLTAKGRLGLLERQIIQANPILEAFGNAQTQRNNNSSRFGKFIRISFAPDGSISGANIDWYLLEKSRVIVRSPAERNFHVFYQLMAVGGFLKESLLLDGGIEDYEFLNRSRREVDGVNDRDDWDTLISALEVVGFSQTEQFDLFRIVAAILHIGNIAITSTRADDAVMADPTQAERACHLLGIPMAEFTRAVLRPKVLAGREWVTQARTGQQALDELGALCKTLYEKSFGALVDRINRALDRPTPKSTFIGVLDIAGFEIFEINTYEQLLINFTNEKLQQFFNHHMFVLEQEEYSREGIEWDFVNFKLDLQPTIDLIEASGSTIGILSCLDEECIMPKATDLTFTEKVHSMWSGELRPGEQPHPGRAKYSLPKFEQGFIITHYAGKVEYRTDGWLEKNKDPLNDNLTRVLAASTEPYVASLFQDFASSFSHSPSSSVGFSLGKKRGVKKGAFRTVAQRHREQLSLLMAQLHATQPHFVRCIVPNVNKKAGRVDVPLVLDQLRCNGVLEGIRIARLGYPNRLPFVEFRQRYEIMTPGIIPRGYMDGRKACLRMVGALELDTELYRVGTSKIFFKAGVLAELEERRDALLYDVFSRLQAVARKFSARRQMKKILNRAIAIRTIQRNARVYGDLRDWPWWQLYTKVRPLLAATRNDEELRRKDIELQLIKERAERDQREKENLEKVKMALEAEKQKIVEEFEAERALALDKDSLLERSKQREIDLEEEIKALQGDLDVLDSQLDRSLLRQKETDEKHENLRQAFDQAAEHLVRLESQQNDWKKQEAEFADLLSTMESSMAQLRDERDEVQKLNEDFTTLISQRDEDLARLKERSETSTSELQSKLAAELRTTELLNVKVGQLENGSRQAKDQLAELTRTANEYSTMIQKKEDDIARLASEVATSKRERTQLQREIIEIRALTEKQKAELDASKADADRTLAAKAKLQVELDDLRALLETKTTEETRRREVEKSKDVELADLRRQAVDLQSQLNVFHKTALENESNLNLELERVSRQYAQLESAHASLLESERRVKERSTKAESVVAALEKTKRTLESELQALRSRQIDSDSQLAEALKAKESLERQLASAQSKYNEIEDTTLQLERDARARERQLEQARKQLEAESAKYNQLHHVATNQKRELALDQDRLGKMDAALNKALTDLKSKEWEVKQLESRQDKKIVEHVHVLEKAKKVTDQQLKEAQEELQKTAVYIRSLEKAKMALTREAEDFVRENKMEQVEIRAIEKIAKANEEKSLKALAALEAEHKAREIAESGIRRLQAELNGVKDELEATHDQLSMAQRSKESLESELATLAEDIDATPSNASAHRQYELKISHLVEKLRHAETAQGLVANIKAQVDRQHKELRNLIMKDTPIDDSFRSRLVRELQLADDELAKQLSGHVQGINVPETPRSVAHSVRSERPRALSTDVPRTPDSKNQSTALKQQIQELELRIAGSDRIRQHLEHLIRDLTADLESSNGSTVSLQSYRQRLAKENARLSSMLKDEATARRAAEAVHAGDQAVWEKFQNAIAQEREAYARLEDSRKALLAQQRNSQVELEEVRKRLRELSQSRKQIENELADTQDKLDAETSAKNDAINAHRQLQTQFQELQITSAAAIAMQSELQEAIESYKQKMQISSVKLQDAEISQAKAEHAEAFARRAFTDVEKAHMDLVTEKKAVDEKLQSTEQKLRELEQQIEEEDRESSELGIHRHRLVQQLQDERLQHQKDLAERDFAGNQTRKKYQAELAQLSEELQSQRDTMTRLREDNRKIHSDYDELQLRFDEEVYNGGAWKREKERLETKIADVTKAYETSTTAQSDQQAQIVSLHSQVRELRGVLNDAEADRAMLQKARRSLQAELEGIKLDHIDASRVTSDREMQKLQLEKQDLERSLEEQEDRVSMAFGRMKAAETHAAESQLELDNIRLENTELDRKNAQLEKQVKELNVRVVDMETKSYTTTPQPNATIRQLQARVEELTTQLNQATSDKRHSTQPRSSDKAVREIQLELQESERQRTKLEDDRKTSESQIQALREKLDKVQSTESELVRANRRLELQAVEAKQTTLTLEREVERLRSRISRPASSVMSDASSNTVISTGASSVGSPRKYKQ
ncbi:nonmuscle myosin heavy chain b [Melanogaster broomeanus]|nr:nonmuscle myosin heavy chain b [Melanogaster broomeanus]